MGTPPLKFDIPKLQRAMDAWADASFNVSAASRATGIDRSTLKHQIEVAKAEGIQAHVKPEKLRIRIPARTSYQPTPSAFGKAVRVLVWGDAHDSPHIPDKSRFRHLGMLASELEPDFIVDVGDSADIDSLSSHAVPGSMDDRARPAFLTEISSLTDAYGEFNDAAPSADVIPRYHLDGNHCYRATRFENNNPTTAGAYTIPLEQVFARYGFTTKKYKEWLFIEGVGFVHVPINAAGKEYGGLNAEQTIARESTFPIVFGHTHRSNKFRRHKIGIGHGIDIFNTGSFMPHGMVKQYAGLSQTGWTYSAHEMTLRDGQIESVRSWSVLELAERFS